MLKHIQWVSFLFIFCFATTTYAQVTYYDDSYQNDPSYNDSYQYYSNSSRPAYLTDRSYHKKKYKKVRTRSVVDVSDRMPATIAPFGEPVVIVDPRVHAFGAYDANGQRVRVGMATAGARWCPDIGRSCRTKVGSFRVQSLGNASCKSSIYPLPRGGAPMPYCMFFNKNQGLHGSYEVVDGNASHGCVRLHVADAQWLRYNFIHIGTKVIIKPY